MNIKFLDCTLRDGGYVNNWKFGYDSIRWIVNKLQNANINIIELGYIRDKDSYNSDRAIFSSTEDINKMFEGFSKKTQMSAMIDFGDCDEKKIGLCKDSFIDILRVTFRKPKLEEAMKYCKKLIAKGYDLYVQPVSITSYSDKEMLELIEKINEIHPKALSIVDSYGLMHDEKVLRYFYLMDNNLLPDIGIAYHSHNNFQLAYSNSIKLLNHNCKRELTFDASLYGMGKSAGNCNTELLAMYLNENFGKNYDIAEILDIIDMKIMSLASQYKWGYQLPFYISALNDCHPNYVNYLLGKNLLTVKNIHNIVSKIDETKKLIFDKDYIENLYLDYQQNSIDDSNTRELLKNLLSDKTILLLGPGKSVIDESYNIKSFVENTDPIIFSLNHINKIFNSNFVFFSNSKRYEQFCSGKNDKNLIITSNIHDKNNIAEHVINWNDLYSKDTIIGYNSLYIFLKLLIKLNKKKVYLAGCDGFSDETNTYYDSNFEFYHRNENSQDMNKATADAIKDFRKYIQIEFLTPSKYEIRDECNAK